MLASWVRNDACLALGGRVRANDAQAKPTNISIEEKAQEFGKDYEKLNKIAPFHGICSAEETTGVLHAVDGAGFCIADTDIRLHGIVAPFRCPGTERDRFNRALATCFRKDKNISGMMVGVRMALVYWHCGLTVT